MERKEGQRWDRGKRNKHPSVVVVVVVVFVTVMITEPKGLPLRFIQRLIKSSTLT